MKNAKLINIAGIAATLVLFLFAAGYFLTLNRKDSRPAATDATPQTVAQTTTAQTSENPFLQGQSQPTEPTTETNIVALNQTKSFMEILDIIIRLVISVILAAVLAFRPRKNIPLFRRNLYVAQTQILLAVVAAALMMIVGDNTARAFAIFAAVSLVRFRTNIRDPKEITVLLISLAIGLATGVGRWELGLVLCLFALVLLWLLEYREPEEVFRSMQLTVKTRDTDHTQEMLKKIFNRYKLDAEVRQIDPPNEEGEIGCIMYYLNLRLNISTDSLSEAVFNSDADNIDGIQWDQKKNASNIYQ